MMATGLMRLRAQRKGPEDYHCFDAPVAEALLAADLY